ncbi:MAG TPA: hypothetical protein VII46_09975 [Acidimicrobiales bacterium]
MPLPDPCPGPTDDPFDRTPLVLALLDQVPEFRPTYRTLVVAYDDDPGEPVVLTELADFVTGHLMAEETEISTIRRIASVIESGLISLGDDDLGRELVGWAFLDSMAPEVRARLAPWLGPRSVSLLESLALAPGEGERPPGTVDRSD